MFGRKMQFGVFMFILYLVRSCLRCYVLNTQKSEILCLAIRSYSIRCESTIETREAISSFGLPQCARSFESRTCVGIGVWNLNRKKSAHFWCQTKRNIDLFLRCSLFVVWIDNDIRIAIID